MDSRVLPKINHKGLISFTLDNFNGLGNRTINIPYNLGYSATSNSTDSFTRKFTWNFVDTAILRLYTWTNGTTLVSVWRYNSSNCSWYIRLVWLSSVFIFCSPCSRSSCWYNVYCKSQSRWSATYEVQCRGHIARSRERNWLIFNKSTEQNAFNCEKVYMQMARVGGEIALCPYLRTTLH